MALALILDIGAWVEANIVFLLCHRGADLYVWWRAHLRAKEAQEQEEQAQREIQQRQLGKKQGESVKPNKPSVRRPGMLKTAKGGASKPKKRQGKTTSMKSSACAKPTGSIPPLSPPSPVAPPSTQAGFKRSSAEQPLATVGPTEEKRRHGRLAGVGDG